MKRLWKSILWRIRLWRFDRAVIKLNRLGLIIHSPDYESLSITTKGRAVMMHKILQGEYKRQ